MDVVKLALSDPAVGPEKAREAFALFRDMERWDAEKQFTAALSRLQQRLPRIKKHGKIEFESKRTNTSQSTPYALFEDIDKAIRPMLDEEGFSIAFGTAPLEKGGLLVTATLSHKAGHSRTESMPLPFDTSGSKNSIQAVGSTLSYGKRYLVCAMLNIITEGEDDDGRAISTLDEGQRQSIEDMLLEMPAESRDHMLRAIGYDAVSDIQKGAFVATMSWLRAKRKALGLMSQSEAK